MKIEGIPFATLVKTKEFGDILASLNIGDNIKAQVMSISGNDLTLRFSNGATIVATSIASLEVFLGDFLELSVKSKSEQQVVFETIKNTNQDVKTKDIVNNLLSLKLAPDERNIEIGKSLINQNVILNKENFLNVINAISKFEGINIEKAVFFVANKLSTVNDAIELLNKFESNSVEIGKMIDKLTSQLAQEPKLPIDKIISEYVKTIMPKIIQEENNNISLLMSKYKGINNEIVKLTEVLAKQFVNFSKALNEVDFKVFLNQPISSENIDKTFISGEQIKVPNKGVSNKATSNNIIEFLNKNPEIRQALINILNDKPMMEKIILKIESDNPTVFKQKSSDQEPDVMLLPSNDKSVNIQKVDRYEPDITAKIKQFFDISNILKENRITNPLDVNKLYNEILLKLDIIEKIAQNKGLVNSENIMSGVNELKNNISFINNVNNTNNMFSYFQLPVIINQKEVNVDLYFVKNPKKSAKIDPKNSTIFVSLDTNNLGIVETLISINNNKVNFDFRLEDDKTIDYFTKRQNILDKLISEKGYKINKVKFSINPKRTNIINFNKLIEQNKIGVERAIDVRV